MQDPLRIRSYTYPALTGAAEAVQAGVGAVFDDDAIKVSIATSTSAVVYSGAQLDGVIGLSRMMPRRGLTVTTGTSAATYRTGASFPITASGYVYVNGFQVAKSVIALLTAAGGNETIDFSDGLDQMLSISVPGQLGTGGTFKFGVGDIYANIGQGADGVREDKPFRGLLGMGTGAFKVGYSSGVDVFASADGRAHGVSPNKVFRVGTTVTAFQILA